MGDCRTGGCIGLGILSSLGHAVDANEHNQTSMALGILHGIPVAHLQVRSPSHSKRKMQFAQSVKEGPLMLMCDISLHPPTSHCVTCRHSEMETAIFRNFHVRHGVGWRGQAISVS